MVQSIRLAKTVYWLAGLVARIKTPQRLYEINDAGDLDNMFTRLPNWTWMSCPLTWRMLGWAQSLDHKHFDHWALDHSQCADSDHLDVKLCGVCDSYYCVDTEKTNDG